MKGGLADVVVGKNTLFENFRKVVLPIITLVLLLKITFSSYFSPTDSLLQILDQSSSNGSTPGITSNTTIKSQFQTSWDRVGIAQNGSVKTGTGHNKCNIFVGNWVPDPKGPYYTNETNCVIDDRQNCMKFGRPDSEFMKWRWKPDDCELPLFDAMQFLTLMKGKTLAFVGDSLSRNQMQSLVCLLASVAIPADVSYSQDSRFRRWLYADYNFTIKALWSPHLVNADESDPNGYSYNSLMKLYVDEADEVWTSQVEKADIVIISAGQWFFRPFLYYKKGQLVGCHQCNEKNTTKFTHYYGYRMAFRTVFKTLLSLKKLKGRLIMLRPFSPAHFENGDWDKGGNCTRRRPFTKHESKLDGYTLKMYLTQVEEFRAAQKEGNKRGVKFWLLDTTEAMILRQDGHPNHYGHWPHEKKLADCVHWCMPGPVDTWNEFLLHVLKMEEMD